MLFRTSLITPAPDDWFYFANDTKSKKVIRGIKHPSKVLPILLYHSTPCSKVFAPQGFQPTTLKRPEDLLTRPPLETDTDPRTCARRRPTVDCSLPLPGSCAPLSSHISIVDNTSLTEGPIHRSLTLRSTPALHLLAQTPRRFACGRTRACWSIAARVPSAAA